MKEKFKNNVIYGLGLLGLLYLLMWLEPTVFANVPLITPVIIVSAFVCCTCSFDFVANTFKEGKVEKMSVRNTKRLREMLDYLINLESGSLRVYKAKFTEEELNERLEFIMWYLEDNHVNFRIKQVNDKKFGDGFEVTIKNRY